MVDFQLRCFTLFILVAWLPLVRPNLPYVGESKSKIHSKFKSRFVDHFKEGSNEIYIYSPVTVAGKSGWLEVWYNHSRTWEWHWTRDDSAKLADHPQYLQVSGQNWRELLTGMRADCPKIMFTALLKQLTARYGQPSEVGKNVQDHSQATWKLRTGDVRLVWDRGGISIEEHGPVPKN